MNIFNLKRLYSFMIINNNIVFNEMSYRTNELYYELKNMNYDL